ncbi:hypothetical protein ABPG75_007807 [Micractinium tetrahymenae]
MVAAARFLLLAAVAAACICCSSARELKQPVQGDLWAVLIAGSAGYGNYRHQADICHAYQILRHGGVKEDHIITMMYDDIADHPSNPHPGKLFNRPKGPDVYTGVKIDYSHEDVNAENFLAVLAGNASAVNAGRRSSRRVLETGPNDKVFVYYSDHGAPGIVGMPSGPFLYADQLHAVIATRARERAFGEMVVYIEACESGSMFEGLLEEDLRIYATTAANAHESSWGTYCPGMNPSPPPEFGTCLGDLYSVAWMENAEHADLTLETLKKQFQLVKQRVSQNFTYSQGSHVLRFGALPIGEEPAAEFMGYGNTGDGTVPLAQPLLGNDGEDAGAAGEGAPWVQLGAVAQREADLLPLWHAAQTAPEGAARAAAARELEAEVSRRTALDASVTAAVRRLLASPASGALPLLHFKYGGSAQLGPLLAAGLASPSGTPPEALVAAVVGQALPRPAGTALVDDWDCLRAMVGAWEGACGRLDQYGMRHTRAFANLCNTGLRPADLGAAAAEGCTTGSSGAAVLIGPDAHVAEA